MTPVQTDARPRRRALKVHTWADGYGTWHARVTGPRRVAERTTARAATRAIEHELNERAPRGVTLTVALRLVESESPLHNRPRTRTDHYVEAAT